MPPLKSQQDQRRAVTLIDQHGRAWSASIEIASGHPTGLVTPKGWTAPLDPPPAYRVVTKGAHGEDTFRIDYDAWLASLDEAHKEWRMEAHRLAVAMGGDQAPALLERPTVEFQMLVGPKPQAMEPVRAARAGNKWVLGLSPVKPEWAREFFPDRPTAQAAHDADLDADRALFPDADETTEALLDLEEQFDPDAVGGKRTKVKGKAA